MPPPGSRGFCATRRRIGGAARDAHSSSRNAGIAARSGGGFHENHEYGPSTGTTFSGAMTGFLTLLYKELLRFWKVGFQTVFAPVVSTLLYLMIFSHALEDHVQAYPGVPYTVFLAPGLIMMAMLQNAFANSSSSL